MTNFKALQDLKTKKIKKISEIEKIINCPCGKGKMKLKMFYVFPKEGKVMIKYGDCTGIFCSYNKHGIAKFTDIKIKKLALGE